MSLPYEKQLAEIEDHCRLAGYEISLAMILGWFIDNERNLLDAFEDNHPTANELRGIVQRLTDELDESFP